MIIAVTYENEKVFRHFGHTEQFKIYKVENCDVSSSSVIQTNGSGHGALADFLVSHGDEPHTCGDHGCGCSCSY